MEWEKARKTDYPDILSFLQEREWACVSLTARLRESGFPSSFQIKNHALIRIRRSESGALCDLIYEGYHGLVIPVLGPGGPGGRSDIDELYERETPYLFSLIGLRRDIETLEHAIKRTPLKSINYHLMTRETSPAPHVNEAEPHAVYRRAGVEAAQMLFPLQRAYEKEEVLLDPSRFDAEACMYQLREALRNGIVVYAAVDGVPVAKAGTNAIGFEWAQIGGVFTVPEQRNRGIGAGLMRYLLTRIADAGYRSTLFVKHDNAPAVALYRGLEFEMRDDFRISYY